MRSSGLKNSKIKKNDLNLHFFAKIFGQFKKKPYLCTLFRRKCMDERLKKAQFVHNENAHDLPL